MPGFASARMTPRTALTSRDDQPGLVKIVRSVLWVAWRPLGRMEIAASSSAVVELADQAFELGHAARAARASFAGGCASAGRCDHS